MRIPQITIHQTFGQIGLNITPAAMQIQKENSSVNVHVEPSETHVQYREPDIQMDWQPVWDEIGLKGVDSLGQKIKSKGKSKTLEIIGQLARDGDRLGNIASGEKNTAGNLAKEKFFRQNRVETSIAAIPSKGPTYEAKTYAPEIDVRRGAVTVSPNNIDPVIDYQVGDVSVHWIQRPNVDISI